MIRKLISMIFTFLGVFGIFYAVNIGDYAWAILSGGIVVLGGLILKKAPQK